MLTGLRRSELRALRWGHVNLARSMQTTKQYLHLAGVVFRDDADALSRRLLGVQDPGTKSPETASLRESG